MCLKKILTSQLYLVVEQYSKIMLNAIDKQFSEEDGDNNTPPDIKIVYHHQSSSPSSPQRQLVLDIHRPQAVQTNRSPAGGVRKVREYLFDNHGKRKLLANSDDDDDDDAHSETNNRRKKINKPFVLYQYQQKMVARMAHLESGDLIDERMLIGGPTGSVSARDTRIRAIEQGHPTHLVSIVPHAGFLCSPVGSGKTAVIISHLKDNPMPSRRRETIDSSLLYSVKFDVRTLNINIVVVPSNLIVQWLLHIKYLDVEPSWVVVGTTKVTPPVRQISYNLFAAHPEILHEDTAVTNVLISTTKWTELLKETEFHTTNRVLRVIKDEGDADNSPIYFADFIWFVSATMTNLFRLATTTFGSAFRTNSIKGALKSALYKTSNAQLAQLTIEASAEEIAAEIEVPPYSGSYVYFTASVRYVPDVNATKLAIHRNTEDFCNASAEMSAKLCESARRVFSSPDVILGSVYYFCASKHVANFFAHTSTELEKEGINVVHVDSIVACNRIYFEQQSRSMRRLFILNGSHLNAGLNLQCMDVSYLIGEIPGNICTQMLGRSHRPPRERPLIVVRMLPRYSLLDVARLEHDTEHPNLTMPDALAEQVGEWHLSYDCDVRHPWFAKTAHDQAVNACQARAQRI